MDEIVNLRTERRRREKQAQAQQAADNRARFGRTAAEKQRDRIRAEQLRSVLDGARLEPDPPTGG